MWHASNPYKNSSVTCIDRLLTSAIQHTVEMSLSFYVIHSINKLLPFTTPGNIWVSNNPPHSFCCYQESLIFHNVKINSNNLKTPWPSLTPISIWLKGSKRIHSLLGTLTQVSRQLFYNEWHFDAISSLSFLSIMKNYTPGILSSNCNRTNTGNYPPGQLC